MSHPTPPRWARALARFILRGPHREFVLGDLDEMYGRLARPGRVRVLRYLTWVLRSWLLDVREGLVAGLRMDVVVALRQFRRRPRVYFGGALVLAVGLGVSTVTWGVRYGGTGRDLPVSDPSRVVSLHLVDLETRERLALSPADAELISDRVPEMDRVGLWNSWTGNLADEHAPPEPVDVYSVSADLFDILELTPSLGRLLARADGREGAPPVAVLGHCFWTDRYGSDSDIVGRTVRVDGVPLTVVGVLQPESGLTSNEDIWVHAGLFQSLHSRGFYAFARMKQGVDATRTSQRLAAVAAGRAASSDPAWTGRSIVLTSVQDVSSGGVQNVRNRVLSIGGVLLFVMALANVANLFSASTRTRAQELSVRRALGAGRMRVLRQLMTEASLPAILGFVGAAAIAAWGLEGYQVAADEYGSGFVWQLYRLELPHVLLLLGGCVTSTMVVSFIAASRELRGDGGRRASGPREGVGSGFRIGRVLLGVEIAVGAALLLVAGLMLRSGWNLRTIDFGFATRSVMTADVTLGGEEYALEDHRLRFWHTLQAALLELPGVEAATVGAQLPLIRCCDNRYGIEIAGWEVDDPARLPIHYGNAVSPTYFSTFQRPVLSGRGITSADGPDSDPVVVVNRHFAESYFPGRNPIGERVRLWLAGEPGPWRTVVGVAPHLWMDTDVNANPEGVYLPLAQSTPVRASFAVRVAGDAEAYADPLRAMVQSLDPELALRDVRTMPQLFRDRTSLYRLVGPLFTLLGLSALLLAVGGLYASISYMASLRTAEFGLRAALGATRRELMTRAVSDAALPVVLGTTTGLLIGLLTTRGFDRFVFLVDPWSPAVAIGTVIVLAASATAASAMPALRAGRVDPVDALRSE